MRRRLSRGSVELLGFTDRLDFIVDVEVVDDEDWATEELVDMDDDGDEIDEEEEDEETRRTGGRLTREMDFLVPSSSSVEEERDQFDGDLDNQRFSFSSSSSPRRTEFDLWKSEDWTKEIELTLFD